MSERPNLEPCPCCGGPGKLKASQGRQVRQGWVGCPACQLYISWKISPDGAVRKWNRRTTISLDPALYDREEIFPDCTVQVLTNTATGQTSVGWWLNGEAAT